MESSLKIRILKESISVLPIWLGTRFFDNSDYSAFDRALYMYRRFAFYNPFTFFNAEELKDAWPYMGRMELDIKKSLNGIEEPVVIFFIVTPRVAECVWLNTFSQNLKKYRCDHQKNDIFVYKIIMGGSGFQKDPRYTTESKYNPYERKSIELGGIYSYLNTDAPSNGCKRLVDLMNRILGMDLLEDEFPNYNMEELQKIAWNINRENFNSGSVRKSSIPKYPIIDGKPKFAF